MRFRENTPRLLGFGDNSVLVFAIYGTFTTVIRSTPIQSTPIRNTSIRSTFTTIGLLWLKITNIFFN